MEPMTLKTYSFLYDKKATEQAYRNFNTFCVEQCPCSFCENFNASRDEIYTAEFLKLLHKIGINPRQEAEVYHIKACNNNKHLYGGWFHFVGRLNNRSPSNGQSAIEKINFGENLKVFITDQTMLIDSAFQNKPVLQLEFIVVVPWLIEENT